MEKPNWYSPVNICQCKLKVETIEGFSMKFFRKFESELMMFLRVCNRHFLLWDLGDSWTESHSKASLAGWWNLAVKYFGIYKTICY